MDQRKHSGKVVVVTGAANGIGQAYAERFALEGAATVIADLITPKLRRPWLRRPTESA